MKKLLTLVALAVMTLSASAQGIEIQKTTDGTTTTVATYSGSGYKAVLKKSVDNVIAGHEYVDLGLPSGTLWATCNVGATNPEDYGQYFAWGMTTGHSVDGTGSSAKVTDGYLFNYVNYTYMDHNVEDWVSYTKYTFNDGQYDSGDESSCGKWYDSGGNYIGTTVDNVTYKNKTSLESTDDAASVNWGGGWRMPTHAEFLELYNNTTPSWTSDNGVSGRKFTNKTDPSKFIFLPAAGYRYDGYLVDAGDGGYYWSSELCEDYSDCAWSLYFDSNDVDPNGDAGRYYGRSVRPVRSKN